MRYTLSCAARVIDRAMDEGGEAFVFDMGEPVRIVDVAKAFIRHSGYTPGPDVEILFTGIRREERLYEEILPSEETVIAIRHKKILASREAQPDSEVFLVEV